MAKDLWLIQRGRFRKVPNEDIVGVDSLLCFDIMGSSDFEWGALPASLRRMVTKFKVYDFFIVDQVKDMNGQPMIVYCKKTEKQEIFEAAVHLSQNGDGYKEYCDMVDYINSGKGIHGNDFWWDILNDFFVFFGSENEERVEIAMDKMKIKWAV